MFRTFIKISVRTLLKHKAYATVNCLGLALGFTAFILIGLYIQHELSWDKTNENYDQIYRVQLHYAKTMYAMDGNDISPHSPAVTAQILEKQFPEFEKVTVIHENKGKFLASVPHHQVYDESGICADSCYFDVFTYQFVEGSIGAALDDPFCIVLSKTLADKLFNGESAIGKTVTLEKKYGLKVTGVYTDLPENTTIRPAYIMSFSTLAKTDGITRSSVYSNDCMNFTLLKPGTDYKFVEQKIRNVFADVTGYEFEELQLCPMSKLHLDFNGNGDYYVVLILYGLIGLFILLMSAFNYINLTTANTATRGKEVAMKKVSGSKQQTLLIQFLSETLIISLLALFMAYMLVEISLPLFEIIVSKQIGLDWINDHHFILLTILIAIGVGIVSGVYPALFLTSQKIGSLLKGDLHGKGRGKFNLKKALVTTQFAISVFLILITLSFSLQIRYLAHKKLGFNKESMLYAQIDVTKSGISFNQLKNRLLQYHEIIDGSMSEHIPFVSFGGGKTNWEGGQRDEKINCRFNKIGYDFVRNMGISILRGRDFSRDFPGDIGKACLINESAARCFGWDNPVGKRLNDNRFTVVGVVKNYIYKDMHNGIEPAILVLIPDEISGKRSFAFRVNPNKYKEAKWILTHEFERTFPNSPFEFRDLDVAFNNENSYKIYHAINRTILFFTVFNIFLAIIGLLGLVSFTVLQRTKEIGVRKINGSNSVGIFFMLSKEYFLLLIYALIVAFPTSWLVYEWLPSANKFHMRPWIFILGAAILFLVILLTTFYQTLKAATKNPVEALRYE